MFKIATMIFQQIMTEVSRAVSEDRIMAITKILLKLMKQNGHSKSNIRGLSFAAVKRTTVQVTRQLL
jgi:hypothetical protein